MAAVSGAEPEWVFTPSAHAPIPPPHHPTYSIPQAIQLALAEDAGTLGDVTTLATIPPDTQAVATFLAKADGVLAGLAVADLVFHIVNPTLQVSWSAADGAEVRPGMQFGVVRGSARSILVAERIALNFMQRMSGIATATAAMVKAMAGTSCRILETRKTVPGLRLLDKWAVLIGGGANHRMGLYDMMMIKDNHVAAAGGIGNAVQRAEAFIRQRNLRGMCIEVETRTLAEVDEVVTLVHGATAAAATATAATAATAAIGSDGSTTAPTTSASTVPASSADGTGSLEGGAAAGDGNGGSSCNGSWSDEVWPPTHVTRVMLDNMVVRGKGMAAAADSLAAVGYGVGGSNGLDVSLLSEAVARLSGLGVETEASGNVTLESVGEIARTGVSFVSCGALTHSVTALDISLKIATQ